MSRGWNPFNVTLFELEEERYVCEVIGASIHDERRGR